MAQKVLPNKTDSQINQIVGEGFLLFVTTEDPVLVVVEVAINVATQQRIKSAPSGLSAPQPAATPRTSKVYSGLAECLVESKDGTFYAGWKTAPTLTGIDGVSHTIPDIDLAENDILNLTARPCPEWDVPSSRQATVTTASLRYSGQSLKNGNANVIKWFLWGPHFQK